MRRFDRGTVVLTIRDRVNRLNARLGITPPSELLYERLFSAALEKLLPDNDLVLFPVKSAANFSLMYLLLRICVEGGVGSILELGCGQSTFLLDAVAPGRVTSVETNASWAESISQRVSLPVRHNPLGAEGEYSEPIVGTFDLIVVDGPRGIRRNSRRSALRVLADCLGDEFVVIFDDAERRGERDTIKAFLDTAGRKIAGVSYTHGSSSQAVVYTSKYRHVSFY